MYDVLTSTWWYNLNKRHLDDVISFVTFALTEYVDHFIFHFLLPLTYTCINNLAETLYHIIFKSYMDKKYLTKLFDFIVNILKYLCSGAYLD